MEGGEAFLFLTQADISCQMLESQAIVETQAFPDPQIPSADPLFTHKRHVQSKVPEQGLESRDKTQGCMVAPMDLQHPHHTLGHSPSVLIVFIYRHKYEWNFSHQHPGSFLIPKCSLLHLLPNRALRCHHHANISRPWEASN